MYHYRSRLAISLAVLLIFAAGCHGGSFSDPTALPNRSESGPAPKFVEMAAAAGISYRWELASKRPLNILQTIGNGCAFLDYDNSGNLSILLIGPKLALYKGDGHGHFTDVTHQTGLDKLHGNFMGCAVGDYDNDGYDDLYISAYGGGLLLHNEHGVSFNRTGGNQAAAVGHIVRIRRP
ncbi:MAG TPA: FG-GAP-like repeat-containing protein [Capsulimonadaceae bacterium]|nr:FG-GAP-like repeat-containing protein [Capsulimonadaceae bacterium]